MQFYLVAAGLSAMLSVMLGAFAAHGLKARLTETMLATFQTGVQYQFYHSLGLILIVLLYRQQPSGLMMWSGTLMLAGMVLFSGSLYGLALTRLSWLGPITPLGGMCFVFAWLLLVIAVIKNG
ncbi:MAG: DUF423 domain-containing protein [Paraglaciecola sp.]|uniref:DUF423 domain-containing protein n=1 Tax=Paraglaciecola sp. TaxID=1920173 RepID=UPI00273D5092|nr:DUF423 domain-containing protein [Paraglaciecola sp.]MDP5031246.1 DUF423 domain-containing protein [Paraglaciecola sp.]MDP5041294.1 DUF423 domain-containing protein [Paraglaciecola sp.]MDP5132870.1 DUF423 domain-containing protein [Paraglaciecola sp.]